MLIDREVYTVAEYHPHSSPNTVLTTLGTLQNGFAQDRLEVATDDLITFDLTRELTFDLLIHRFEASKNIE